MAMRRLTLKNFDDTNMSLAMLNSEIAGLIEAYGSDARIIADAGHNNVEFYLEVVLPAPHVQDNDDSDTGW